MRVYRSYVSTSFQEDQMNAKRDVDDENDGKLWEEQEVCDGRISFVTFFQKRRTCIQ